MAGGLVATNTNVPPLRSDGGFSRGVHGVSQRRPKIGNSRPGRAERRDRGVRRERPSVADGRNRGSRGARRDGDAGLLEQPELTEKVFCTEGLKTGDIGYMDADGYLFVLGRRNDMINVGGRKVAPDEIEDLLRQLDGVMDAGCVGEPDEFLGECVKAYLVAGREIRRSEVVAFLRTRVEECKIPQVIELIDSIPRTSSGKIQRQMLRRSKEVAWISGR